MSVANSLRVASFNILHGQTVSSASAHSTAHLASPTDGPPDAAELLASIQDIKPDVLALQEVDRNQARSGHTDQVSLAASALESDHWRFIPTVVGTPGGADGFRATTEAERRHGFVADHPDYGVALISRQPVSTWRDTTFAAAPMSLPLMVQTDSRPRLLKVRDEQRAAIAACISTPTGSLTVVTAHLSFVPGFNIRQLRLMKKWIADLPRPLIFLGDFNLPSGVPARVTGLTPLLREATFPSYKPRVQLDHILSDGLSPLQLEAAKASARVWQLPVSDHCAVSIDIPLP